MPVRTRRVALADANVARRFFIYERARDVEFGTGWKRARKFSFATLAAAVISVVLPMNIQIQRRPLMFREARGARLCASPSLLHAAFRQMHAHFAPAAIIARIIPIIRSG
jgi:hypothetical protein